MKHTIALSTQPRRAVDVETIKVQGVWKIAQTNNFGIEQDCILYTTEQAAALIFALECAVESLQLKASAVQAVAA